MKVYFVRRLFEYESDEYLGIFSSLKNAEIAIEKEGWGIWDILEIEIDDTSQNYIIIDKGENVDSYNKLKELSEKNCDKILDAGLKNTVILPSGRPAHKGNKDLEGIFKEEERKGEK